MSASRPQSRRTSTTTVVVLVGALLLITAATPAAMASPPGPSALGQPHVAATFSPSRVVALAEPVDVDESSTLELAESPLVPASPARALPPPAARPAEATTSTLGPRDVDRWLVAPKNGPPTLATS